MIVRLIAQVIVVIVAFFCNGSLAQDFSTPPIPCPDIFEYARDGDTVYGIVTIRNVSLGQTSLRIKMTQAVPLQSNLVTCKGSVSQLNQKTFEQQRADSPVFVHGSVHIDSLVHKSRQNDYTGKLSLNFNRDRLFQYIRSGTPITYRVDFPLQNVVPRVTEIAVNNVIQCSGPKDPIPRSTINLEHDLGAVLSTPSRFQQQPLIRQQTPIQQRPIIVGEPTKLLGATAQPEPEAIPSAPLSTLPPTIITPTTTTPLTTADRNAALRNKINSICGVENNDLGVTKLAVNGEEVARSRFPWIAAIYTRNTGSLSFQCGANLISTRTVIGSAHCFSLGLETLRPEKILLSLGRHNLNDWQNGMHVDVEAIITHPDFKSELSNLDADIAIIHLKTSVNFSVSIRPLCLWNGPLAIEGTNGIIVGWGEDETHSGVTSIPKLVNATVVSETACIRSNDKFLQLTSNRTLCAGNRDGSGPCHGDSGSGLMVKYRQKWMLRGLVSASLSNSANECNLQEYVVYTDVAKFKDWIDSNLLL